MKNKHYKTNALSLIIEDKFNEWSDTSENNLLFFKLTMINIAIHIMIN